MNSLKYIQLRWELWNWFKEQDICLWSNYGIETIEEKGLIDQSIQIPKSWADYAVNDLKEIHPEMDKDEIYNIVKEYIV